LQCRISVLTFRGYDEYNMHSNCVIIMLCKSFRLEVIIIVMCVPRYFGVYIVGTIHIGSVYYAESIIIY